MLFVSFILVESREDQRCTAPVLWGLISPPKNTHLCFLGLHECIRTSRRVQNNRLLLERITAVSIKPCEAGMKGVVLVFISPVNYWYLPPTPHPLDSPGTRVENVSLHNGHIAQTCCLGCSGGERRQGAKQKCVNSVPPSLIQHSCASADFYCIWPHLFFH